MQAAVIFFSRICYWEPTKGILTEFIIFKGTY